MLVPTYPIYTNRLLLRPFCSEDLADLYAFHSRPDVTRFLYWEVRTLAETQAVLQRKQTETRLTAEGARLSLAVSLHTTDADDRKVIGEVSLVWRSQEHRQGEVGFVFNPDYGGHGYATEATQAILALGFAELKLHRIYGRCDPRNRASYKLMARLGMRREAHFRHNEIFKGEWGDEFVYAMLQEEWLARQDVSSLPALSTTPISTNPSRSG